MALFNRFMKLLVAGLALMGAQSAHAITKNWTQDFDHPYVGLVVFYDAEGSFLWRCSGSLIAPNKVLTAGHCTDASGGAVSARVYFQQDAGAHYDPVLEYDPVSLYPNDCAPGTLGTVCATSTRIYNYGFTQLALIGDNRDVGLVILDQPIVGLGYGELPAAGTLDALKRARGKSAPTFTVSGYGLTYKTQPQSGLPNVSLRERLMAQSVLVNLTSSLTDGYNLQTEGNGDGRGGTCSGDSGGPVFLGDARSSTIVSVTSFGLNALCRGTDFSYRIDRAGVIDWINNHN